jgi:hypothetical protein
MITTVLATELTGLRLAEARAEAMAAGGHVARGFMLLASGLQRARAAWDACEPWGKELARRYQEALDCYSERHTMKTTVPGPCLWRVTLPEPCSYATED